MSTREQQRVWERAYYERNKDEIRVRRLNFKDKFREQGLSYRQATRERLLSMYGRCCAICSYADSRALSLDHIHGDGNEERRQVGETGVYRLALLEHNPNRYRILCMNCQFIEHKERCKPQQHGECLEGLHAHEIL